MLDKLKRSVALRLARFLRYWTTDFDNNMPHKIAAYRAQGMRIGEEVAIYDSDLDGLYPQLITIGSNVIITHAVVLAHDDAPLVFCRRRRVAPVVIGDNVFVGHGALILPGCTIGSNCVIAARSVVTKDVPPGSIVAGIPARVIRDIETYKTSLATDASLLDVPIRSILTMEQEPEIRAAALERHRPDLTQR